MRAFGVGSQVPLVGRAADLDRLRAVVERAATGQAGAAVVEGEAGIGKSRLVAEAVEFARGLGFRVFIGACDQIEQDRPLRAVGEALEIARGAPDRQRAELAEMLLGGPAAERVVPAAGTADEGWLIVEAVLDVLDGVASKGPVALVIEDLQWADSLTLRAMHAIARRSTRLPLAWFVTVRPGSQSVAVDRTVTDLLTRGAEHVVLGPLGADDVAELAREVAGVQVGAGLLARVEVAGGNPLFVIELVRALADDGAIDAGEGRADAEGASLPPGLRLTVLRRLSLLPEDSLNLLRVASILSTFSMAELVAMAGRSTADLVPAVAAVVDAGLLTESGDRLTFRHELVRDVIYHDLPVAVRKGLHREAGTALSGAGAAIERVAIHVGLGAEAGDAAAVVWLRQAASRAAARAPATSIRLLERARELIDPVDPTLCALEAELIEPLVATGRSREAENLARDILGRGVERDVEVMVRTSVARALSLAARYPEAIHELEQARSAAAGPERESLAAAAALLMVLAGQVQPAGEAAQRTVDAAERSGNEQALCQGLQTLGMVALAEGFIDRAIAFGQRAVAVAQRNEAAWAYSLVPHLWHGTALADADRLEEAEAAFHAGRWRAEHTGNVAALPLYYWAIAELRLAAGRWDDAVAEAQAGLGLVEETSTRVGDVFANAVCAHVAFHRGDSAAARAAVREAQRRLVAGPVEIGFEWMTWMGALLLEAEGQPTEALSRLAQAWDLGAPLRYLQAASRAMGPDLVRLALGAGDRERARSVTAELERSAELSPTATARGLALRCRGLLDDDPDVLLEAVATHRDGPRPYQLAAACEDAGTALARRARTREAIDSLSEAVAGYERLEAARDVGRVQSALRTLGVRPARRAPRRPAFGWDGLTPSELRIVGLVAGGLSNREIADRLFVSRRTVATHLEHVFQKLGHANRVELAADATRRTR
jgi:DNA-binding CsgD family transcriptional regulator/tetratricopeptide (TPR) repeat protein